MQPHPIKSRRARRAPRATVALLVRIDPFLKERLGVLALRLGCPESRIVETALRETLDDVEGPAAAPKDGP